MKFKIGDRVVYTGNRYDTVKKGHKGTIIAISNRSSYPYYNIQFDRRLGRSNEPLGARGSELEPLAIPDTKIGRKLYKNRIKEIKGGKIYLT
jgi:hypothetical protein